MILSNLSKLDKKELLEEIKKISIEYREKLNFSENLNYGIELEFEKAYKRDLKEIYEITGSINSVSYNKWKYEVESLFTEKKDDYKMYGGEIVSPILKNDKESFKQIKKVCEIMKEKGAVITDNTAFHIHVSRKEYDDNLKLVNLLKVYMLYEDIIFRFGYYGKNPREVLNQYSKSVSYFIYYHLKMGKGTNYNFLLDALCLQGKENAISISNYIDTIEFRNCNGTIDPIIIQNNINLYCSLMENSINFNLDIDKINYEMNKFSKPIFMDKKPEVDFDRALEFADIVFKDDLDKKYFLKQYTM